MTSREAPKRKSPLEERLIDMIKLKGPISIADYMADALGHPHDGYYNSGASIGADGDFITAPEISQIFGELIGAWLVEAWREIGSPKSFNLIELGPGRGVLMADILRAAQLRRGFVDAANIWLVETSGRLRHEQQKRLRAAEPDVQWADTLDDAPPGPSLIVANEFFDCLPIRQFQKTQVGWRERLIGLTSDEQSLAFTLDKTPPPPNLPLPDPLGIADGKIFEISEATRTFIADLCARLSESPARALIIDYGHRRAGLGDTLQSVRNHAFWPPLEAPGSADLTAHVDFEAIARIAIEAGAAVDGPVPQGEFLNRLGLALRVQTLSRGKSPSEREDIEGGAHRIAGPAQMGEIFKVLCVSSSGLPSPAGFG